MNRYAPGGTIVFVKVIGSEKKYSYFTDIRSSVMSSKTDCYIIIGHRGDHGLYFSLIYYALKVELSLDEQK